VVLLDLLHVQNRPLRWPPTMRTRQIRFNAGGPSRVIIIVIVIMIRITVVVRLSVSPSPCDVADPSHPHHLEEGAVEGSIVDGATVVALHKGLSGNQGREGSRQLVKNNVVPPL
jgi:hypothetical protein